MASMGYCKWWQVTDCEYGMFCLSTVLRLNTHRLKIKFSLDGYSVFLWQGDGSNNLQFLTWIIYLKKSFPILYNASLHVVGCRVLVFFLFLNQSLLSIPLPLLVKRLKLSFNKVCSSCEKFPLLSFLFFFLLMLYLFLCILDVIDSSAPLFVLLFTCLACWFFFTV